MVCVAWFFSVQTSATQSGPMSPASARAATASSHALLAQMRWRMSTSLWRMTWCWTSGWPKAVRWRAQASASSRQASA